MRLNHVANRLAPCHFETVVEMLVTQLGFRVLRRTERSIWLRQPGANVDVQSSRSETPTRDADKLRSQVAFLSETPREDLQGAGGLGRGAWHGGERRRLFRARILPRRAGGLRRLRHRGHAAGTGRLRRTGLKEPAMPFLDRPDGRIRYEVHGAGFPVLLFAPGGLRSRLEMWPSPPGGPARPWVDWTRALPEAGFTAIAMDQRNAGESRTEIHADHGWHTYAADHLALMDHLGFPRFHVLGGCIGGSFCLKAIEAAPGRVASAVLQNPIGLHPEHPGYFPDSHAEWSREQRAPPGRSWRRRRWPASAATCGVATSSSVSRATSSAPARCRPCCCPAPTSPSRRDQHGARRVAAGRRGADGVARTRTPGAAAQPRGRFPPPHDTLKSG
ncbi:alpha/beta fold hydrolase [Dankookia sp. P2]|uniref:alpha/beta fold hydrolase n=1 Tax=Dankookia sp. P2 TaxID=3423955 RepID=UPI003D671913